MFGPGGPLVGMINTWATALKTTGIKLLVTNETQQIDLPCRQGGHRRRRQLALYREQWIPAQQEAVGGSARMFGPDRVPDTASVSAYDGMHLIYQVVGGSDPSSIPTKPVKFMAGMKFDSARPIVDR